MNVLIYASFGDEHMAHALALALSKRWAGARFAAVAFSDSVEGRYLSAEASNVFSRVVTESSTVKAALEPGFAFSRDRLAEIDCRYGCPTVWQFVTHDRRLSRQRNGYLYDYGTAFSDEEILRRIQSRFDAIEELFDEHEPDIVVYAGIDTGPSSALVVSAIAKARGIPQFVPSLARYRANLTLSLDVFHNLEPVVERYRQLHGRPTKDLEIGRAAVDEFRRAYEPPSYAKVESKTTERRALGARVASVGALGRRLFRGVRNHYTHGYAEDPYYSAYWRRRVDDAKRVVRSEQVGRSPLFVREPPQEPYVFFPLHIEPELALLLLNPFHTHQMAVVQNVAQALPYPYKLAVKDHPVGLGHRKLSYFEKLARLPNVVLVDSKVNAHTLIAKSSGVVAISSTAAMEAMLLGKPAFTLGNPFFACVESAVERVSSYEGLADAVSRIDTFEPPEDAIAAFMTALLDESEEGNLLEVRARAPKMRIEEVASEPAVTTLVRLIERQLQRTGTDVGIAV